MAGGSVRAATAPGPLCTRALRERQVAQALRGTSAAPLGETSEKSGARPFTKNLVPLRESVQFSREIFSHAASDAGAAFARAGAAGARARARRRAGALEAQRRVDARGPRARLRGPASDAFFINSFLFLSYFPFFRFKMKKIQNLN